MNFRKMHKIFLEKMQLIPNLKIDSRLKQETQNIIDFMILLIFFIFVYFYFFENYLKKKNKDFKIFNMNSRNFVLFSLKLQSEG